MSNLVSIQGKSTQIVSFKGQNVLTTKQIAEFYETDNAIISNNFNRNQDKYQEGKHYFVLKDKEKREFINHHKIDDGLKAEKFYLWTERGALLHAKSLNTPKAWEVFELLEDCYFKLKEQTQPLQPIPALPQFKSDFDILKYYYTFIIRNDLYFCIPEHRLIEDYLLFSVNGVYHCNRIQFLENKVRIIPNNDWFGETFAKYEDITVHGRLVGKIENVNPVLIEEIITSSNFVHQLSIDVKYDTKDFYYNFTQYTDQEYIEKKEEEINRLQSELLSKYRKIENLNFENNKLKSELAYYKSKRTA